MDVHDEQGSEGGRLTEAVSEVLSYWPDMEKGWVLVYGRMAMSLMCRIPRSIVLWEVLLPVAQKMIALDVVKCQRQ